MRRRAVAGLAAIPALLSGCLYASAGYETFDWRVEPAAYSQGAAEPALSPTEIRYARETARIVFRRRAAERTAGFVSQGPEGYALCLRAGRDYALLVFARRVYDEAISQAADDNTILRSPADTAVCRASGRRWVAT
ncbi:hypothetical protein [Aureimonas endophytica]|uniref:hypothetical protein n=1 Tax=Aureimonas endophytica TaxID=2027858 RepID=UPI00166676F1|nr:hypothetical protein [Aureimonas endophytica]